MSWWNHTRAFVYNRKLSQCHNDDPDLLLSPWKNVWHFMLTEFTGPVLWDTGEKVFSLCTVHSPGHTVHVLVKCNGLVVSVMSQNPTQFHVADDSTYSSRSLALWGPNCFKNDAWYSVANQNRDHLHIYGLFHLQSDEEMLDVFGTLKQNNKTV